MPRVDFVFLALVIAIALFVAMLVLLEFGRRLGHRQFEKYGKASRSGVGVVDGTVFGLLSLLIGFTFAGAAGRYDARRDLIGKEASALTTAWDQIDVLPAGAQPAIRAAFRVYVDTVLAYAHLTNFEHPSQQPEPVTRARHELWDRAVAAVVTPDGDRARMLLLPALNQSFDAVEAEYLARQIHPPSIIFVMLGVTALAGAVFAGFGLAASNRRNWIYSVGIAAAISVAVFVIIELEYPRAGLIQMSAMDQALRDVRETLR